MVPKARSSPVGKKTEKRLAMFPPIWYNVNMKSVIAFLLGMLCTAYFFPPTPTAVLSDMDKRVIAYDVIEWMDKADWDVLSAKRHLISAGTDENKSSFWGF